MNLLRKELEPLPSRMLDLPIDERGYVVPWFVDWVDGKPEFRAMDGKKWRRAIREKLCWVCGGRLGRFMTFVAGPMCGINRTSSEPPNHKECAEWSARNCPFLNDPDMIRREDSTMNKLSGNIGGVAITRNPGVAMLWTTHHYDVFPDGRGGVLIHMGEPESVDWYCRGRAASREEIMRSVEAGIPALESAAILQQEKGAIEHFREMRARFEKYLPAPAPAAAG